MPIYTKTGDDGTTAFFGGTRVKKSDLRIELYGSIDELNSWIGYIGTQLTNPEVGNFLTDIQGDLMTISGVIAGWNGALDALPDRVRQMEARIDLMDKELPELRSFILPGGSPLGATVHITRSVARRVERLAVRVDEDSGLAPGVIQYLNRLSDLLFTLARFINTHGKTTEQHWGSIRQTNKHIQKDG